ncbi:hypothetical protein PMAYCL1PPCAC_24057 [Pristionchus mayeri]|uniref:Uncharacterized protein n=1 Tax=Pristionchus mayeri TaxID=1317129 RepID=A0AAN5I660_9BILA|nr:hypothetical protein PMAYCL1PPCAC_24057 [Pristionchus mayeri]
MSELQAKETVEREEGQVFVVDNRNRDEIIKTLLLVILIIIFPPAAIAIAANSCNIHVCISLVLMLFFVFPAYIHAIWYCFFKKTPENIIA